MENYKIYWSLSVNFRNYFKVISICTIVQIREIQDGFRNLAQAMAGADGGRVGVHEVVEAAFFGMVQPESWAVRAAVGVYRLGLLGKGTMVKRDGSGAWCRRKRMPWRNGRKGNSRRGAFALSLWPHAKAY